MPDNRNQATEEDERVLLARIHRADTVALETLYYRYRPRLHRFLLALGCPGAELDELCNETFYAVWKKAGTFDGNSRLATWIFGIARHKALDLLRRENRRWKAHEMDMSEIPESRINDMERLELSERLAVALDTLPADQRAVVELAFRDGLSYQEIALVMSCPESTVKTRVFHARRKLRTMMPEFAGMGSRRGSG